MIAALNMSLTDKKNALFGAPSSGAAKKHPVTQKPATTPVGNSLPSSKAGRGVLSDAIKAQKKQEAEKLKQEADAYLKTSVFQWSPDYMGAAPKFDGASKAYAAAGELSLAREMSLECSKAYSGYESFSSAGNVMQNAAKIAKDMGAHEQSVRDLIAAAELWGQAGDMLRVSQIYVTIAESEGASEEETAEYLNEAVEILLPSGSSYTDLKRGDVRGVDVLKKLLNFDLSKSRLSQAMDDALRLVRACEAFGQESLLKRALATVTVLQLTNKDVIAAEDTYIQEHLPKSDYASSKEAEIVDSLISAFRSTDEGQLQDVQRHPNLFYLDREVKDLVLKLKMTTPSALKPVSAVEITTEVTETIDVDGAQEVVETTVTEEQNQEDDDEVDLT